MRTTTALMLLSFGGCKSATPTLPPVPEADADADTDTDTDTDADVDTDDTDDTGEPIDDDGDGYVASEDCDDADPLVNPDAEEVCLDGIDNDCDGAFDSDDSDVQGAVDCDGDSLSYDEELVLGTIPNNPDSDGDGTLDGDEDLDEDGLSNLEELDVHLTDPLEPDTDGGGRDDGGEVANGTDPLVPGDDNVAPVVSSVEITPMTPIAGDLLICQVTATDGDGDTLVTNAEWKVNGVTAAVSDTLNTGFVGGDSVTCIGSASDGFVVTSVESAPVIVANSAPTVADVVVTPDPASGNDSLTCSALTGDPDGTNPTVTYSWTVEGTVTGTDSTLAGGFGRGNVVVCEVSADDGAIVTTAASAPVTIVNATPIVESIAVTPDPATAADALTCEVETSDADGDSVTNLYSWTVNGAGAGVFAVTLPASETAPGDVVSCRVISSDGADATAPTPSAEITVQP